MFVVFLFFSSLHMGRLSGAPLFGDKAHLCGSYAKLWSMYIGPETLRNTIYGGLEVHVTNLISKSSSLPSFPSIFIQDSKKLENDKYGLQRMQCQTLKTHHTPARVFHCHLWLWCFSPIHLGQGCLDLWNWIEIGESQVKGIVSIKTIIEMEFCFHSWWNFSFGNNE